MTIKKEVWTKATILIAFALLAAYIVYAATPSISSVAITPSNPTPSDNLTATISASDIDGDNIYYLWDWDDGTFSDWLGPYTSGTNCTETHSWIEQGTYSVRVKAKDTEDAESDWSEPLSVKMPHIMIKQQSAHLELIMTIKREK